MSTISYHTSHITSPSVIILLLLVTSCSAFYVVEPLRNFHRLNLSCFGSQTPHHLRCTGTSTCRRTCACTSTCISISISISSSPFVSCHSTSRWHRHIQKNKRAAYHCSSLYASTKTYEGEDEKGRTDDSNADNKTDGSVVNANANVNVNDDGGILFQDDEELFLQLQLVNENETQNEEENEKDVNNENPQEQEQEREQKPPSQISSSSSSSLSSPSMLFSDEDGAGVPRASLQPWEIAPLLMTALQKNDFPQVDSGLTSMWEFSTDVNKFVFQNNVTDFIESCHDTANEFPTSFYGVALNGKSWKMITELNMVGGDNDNNDKCWIATQIMETICSDGRMRRWQWEFRKNRRPPCLGCWKVETIASSDRKGNFEPEGQGENGWGD